MFCTTRATALRTLLAGCALVLSSALARGQASPPALHGYDFLTVTTIESFIKSEAKLLIAPAFQGNTELQLAAGDLARLTKTDVERITQNTLLLNQQLAALTVAGWELVHVYAVAPASGAGNTPPVTRYLFRKAKP